MAMGTTRPGTHCHVGLILRLLDIAHLCWRHPTLDFAREPGLSTPSRTQPVDALEKRAEALSILVETPTGRTFDWITFGSALGPAPLSDRVGCLGPGWVSRTGLAVSDRAGCPCLSSRVGSVSRLPLRSGAGGSATRLDNRMPTRPRSPSGTTRGSGGAGLDHSSSPGVAATETTDVPRAATNPQAPRSMARQDQQSSRFNSRPGSTVVQGQRSSRISSGQGSVVVKDPNRAARHQGVQHGVVLARSRREPREP